MATDIFSIKLGINSSYLIRGVKGIVMVDAGVPNKIGAFKRKLSRLYIRPGEIKLIVLTHSHFDHAGSSKEIKEFTGARILIHKSEQEYLEKGGFASIRGVNLWGKITEKILFPFFRRIQFPRPVADVVMDSDDVPLYEYGIDGKIIHTPGHTEGSLSILLDTGEAFVGCMAHDGFPFRLLPGYPIYAQNIAKVEESWKILIARGARIIFPGHGNPFPVEMIKRRLLEMAKAL
jgi:hydroxyacylglutathione hydrolase